MVSGQLDGEERVVLEVAAMSLQDYMAMNRTLPDGVSAHEDPAEPGEEDILCASLTHTPHCLSVGSCGFQTEVEAFQWIASVAPRLIKSMV